LRADRLFGKWLIGVYLPLIIFAILTISVWYGRQGLLWDVPILQAIHATAQPTWEPFVRVLTKFGVFWGVFPVATTIALLLVFQKRWRSLLYLVITLPSSAMLNRVAKLLVHRDRPHLWEAFPPEPDYAFPSGHAMSSMTLAVVLVLLAWNSRWQWLGMLTGGIYVTAIGWTRLYLGVHYPSDILAGWLLAVIVAVAMYLFIQPPPLANNEQNSRAAFSKITVPTPE